MTYTFRIRFFVHMAGVISEEEKETTFKLDGLDVRLKSFEDKPIKDSKELVISSNGYETENMAWETGKRVKNSLIIAGMKLKIGIDAGKDKANCSLSRSVKESFLEQCGVKMIDNVHGLSVFDDSHPVQTMTMGGVGLVSPANTELFFEEIKIPYTSNVDLSNKEVLALELYGSSHYEKSERARFLTLILALEALLEPCERDKKTMTHVDSLIDATKRADIPNNQIQSILGSLQWLYKDSISQGIKKLISKYLIDKEYSGMASTKFILHCYDVRSKLVHSGSAPKSIHLGSLSAQLNVLISDLLQRKIYA